MRATGAGTSAIHPSGNTGGKLNNQTYRYTDLETGEIHLVCPTGLPHGVCNLVAISADGLHPYAAITDYLNCTFKFDPAEESFFELFQELFNLLGTKFSPAIDRLRGLHGYTRSFQLGDSSAQLAIGGQGGTVLLTMPGEACSLLHSIWPQIVECLSLSSKRKAGSVLAVQAYIRLKLLTGMRRGDLLRLTLFDLKDDGIHVTPHKTLNSTGKRLIIGWSEEVREAIAIAKAARPMKLSPYIFCNRLGNCYFDEITGRAGGWDSMWRGFPARLLEETKVEEKFTEHDLRAKCASDASSLEHARSLLAHADSRLTDRVYRRKPELVTPLR